MPLEPALLLSLTLTTVLYLLGLARLARRGTPPARWRPLAFLGGIAVLAGALSAPVEALSDHLLSAHMLQHTLLVLAAAPLLALSVPLPALLLGLPRGVRRGLGSLWRRAAGLRRVWFWISRLPAAWLLQTLVIWTWHAPPLYQAALVSTPLHALEHLLFLASSALFWWAAMSRLRAIKTWHTRQTRPGLLPERAPSASQTPDGEASPGWRINSPALRSRLVWLLASALRDSLLGVLLAFSTAPWYALYARAALPGGLTPLADQQFAGVMMGGPGGLAYLLAGLWLLKWQTQQN